MKIIEEMPGRTLEAHPFDIVTATLHANGANEMQVIEVAWIIAEAAAERTDIFPNNDISPITHEQFISILDYALGEDKVTPEELRKMN